MTFRLRAPLLIGLAGCADKGTDSGSTNDAGDGGTTDGGAGDSGSTTDGGTSDGGTSDGGTDSGDGGAAEPDGESLYATWCAACHGAEAEGVKGVGPGLENELHHTDAELVGFVLNGKGTMEPVPVTEAEATLIIEWLRARFEG
jgi:Cytochrome C oxidase, cbb3-type, subunit III